MPRFIGMIIFVEILVKNMTISKKTSIFITVMVVILLVGGCAGEPPLPPAAGLTPLEPGALAEWPGAIRQQGDGNVVRVVTGPVLGAVKALELAAGGQGTVEYGQDVPAGPDVVAQLRLQFLSTQGTGRVQISALDDQGNTVGAVGWVVTGPLPPAQAGVIWLDKRQSANYKGDWLTAEYHVQDLLAELAPAIKPGEVRRYRLSVQAGQGQHVLVTKLQFDRDTVKSLAVSAPAGQLEAALGETVRVEIGLRNTGSQPLRDLAVELVEPYGFGLVLLTPKTRTVAELAPGQEVPLVWQVRAQRPHAVNLGRPWPVRFAVNGTLLAGEIAVRVQDTRPGKVFYVMTEDLEAIDAAGYPKAWGNGNGWLEPAEVLTQMVGKAEKLNAVAETYGAKWTHYIAWPLVKAAQWADGQSTTGRWGQVVAALRQSVQEEAKRGHEYGIHLHLDYDPHLAGNVLSYNPAVDGLWANHLRHGWAHSLTEEGDFDAYNSRTGTLYAYQRILDELAAASGQGQLITARVGSFDFGDGPADEAMSTRVYRKVGLWATSDADGNAGGVTAGDYGGEIYFARPDDINRPAERLDAVGLVELRPTPRRFINYDAQSAAVMNDLAKQGMDFFVDDGRVRPGVHAIVGFTHAMFVMGSGDWQSLEGGQFDAIGEHLRYLKNEYVDRGLLRFATAGELVRAYLDYYAPAPVALYGARVAHTANVSEYAVDILGRDIPIDNEHPHRVSVKYPLYLRDSAYRIAVLKNGEEIYSTWGLPTPYNDIVFTVNDRTAKYTLKVYHNKYLFKLVQALRTVKAKIFIF